MIEEVIETGFVLKYLLSARELGKQRSTSLIKKDTASFMNKNGLNYSM
jgi:hypothetical protein